MISRAATSCTILLLVLSLVAPARAALDPATDALFTAARSHRVAEVESLRSRFGAKPYVWALAAYVADPHAYAATFVAQFPTTAGGVRDDYGYLWLGGILSGVNPYSSLATLASQGNDIALRKLVLAAALVPDGFIGSEVQNDLASAAQAKPDSTLAAVAALSPGARDTITLEKVVWCGPGAKVLRVEARGEAADAQRHIAATVGSACPAAR